MEIVELIKNLGEIAGTIVILIGAIKYIPKGYHWVRSWTYIKRDELQMLEKIEAKHKKCDAELKSSYEICAPFLQQKRAELVRAAIGPQEEIKVDDKFHMFDDLYRK